MDFSFSDEQQMIKDSAARFVRDEYDFETRRKIVSVEPGYNPGFWKTFAELGWLALPFAEDDGGVGGGPVETMIVMEELGRGLVVEPYLASVILAGGALRRAASDGQRAEHVARLISGEAIYAFAHSERPARYNLSHVETTVRSDGGGYVLNGEKAVVLWGGAADHFIVSARSDGGTGDENGISLFLVPKDADGLSINAYPTVDGGRAADLRLENVKLGEGDLLGDAGGAYAVIEAVIQEGIAAVCAEAVGAMRAVTDLTLEYVKTRKQFGTEIGKFQVVQHRMADMFIACEEAQSMSYVATLRLDEDDAGERARAVSAAKARIGETARFVGQQAVQLHGGMGMTEELSVSSYFKRLTMIDALFGNIDHHLKLFAAA